MIKLLFYIGSMQTPEDCTLNIWGSEALNVTQLTLMDAFRTCGVNDVIGIGFPGASSFDTSMIYKRHKHSDLGHGIEIHEPPFISMGPVQPVSQFSSLIWYLMRIPRKSRPDAILISNPMTRLGLPSLLFARLWKIPVVIIVSDINPTMQTTNFIRRVRSWMQHMIVRRVRGVVVFSNHVGREIRGERSWIRMARPPATDIFTLPATPPNSDTRIVYFSGTMALACGVDVILEAIQHIPDKNYRFWFSGRGPLDAVIHEAARHDHRITHWGFVERSRYREMLQEANVLLNPRPTRLPENRYNFPSKLMEYMAAGRPIISTASSDIGEYYRDAIVLLEDETPEGLAKCIQKVCELPYEEQVRLGQRAREHVETESWEAQAQHILDFIETLQ